MQVGPSTPSRRVPTDEGYYLGSGIMMDWLAGLYVNILDLIQYMHDKCYYRAAGMALIDADVRRTFATGIAGSNHAVDSLSAIKYAAHRARRGDLVVILRAEGDFRATDSDD